MSNHHEQRVLWRGDDFRSGAMRLEEVEVVARGRRKRRRALLVLIIQDWKEMERVKEKE